MLIRIRLVLALLLTFFLPTFLSGPSARAQQKRQAASVTPASLLTRTTTRHETRRFGFGGSVTIIGAPVGSVTVEGWSRNEVDISADIELHAETEADLDVLSKVNGFVLDDDVNHISLLSTGTHDRSFMKKFGKEFPRRLLNLPWKVDYHLKVPTSTDVEINAGHGSLMLSGIEGAQRISATESDATLTLTGGIVSATVTAGTVTLNIPTRSWRGGGADIRVAGGVVNLVLPPSFNGDLDADILRAGKIVSTYEELQSREKPGITERVMRARAGVGGAFFKFTVGEGTINISKQQEIK